MVTFFPIRAFLSIIQSLQIYEKKWACILITVTSVTMRVRVAFPTWSLCFLLFLLELSPQLTVQPLLPQFHRSQHQASLCPAFKYNTIELDECTCKNYASADNKMYCYLLYLVEWLHRTFKWTFEFILDLIPTTLCSMKALFTKLPCDMIESTTCIRKNTY